MNKTVFWLLLALGAIIVTGGGGYLVYTTYKQRGIRNNNPGNLRPGVDWQGKSGIDSGIGGDYLIFSDPKWGIRALYKTLLTYRTKYGLTTVRGIISRWAPPSENNTDAYIADVATAVGKGPDTVLALSDYAAIVKRIIYHENGIQPYPDSLIAQGMALA